MKILSWNVNGLRAIVKKNFLTFLEEENPDILCIQETKLQEGQIQLDLPEYKSYFHYAQKKGYSGTAVFTKKEPIHVTIGIGQEAFDDEGRVIALEFDRFYLVTVYSPNAQAELARIEYRMTFEDALREYLLMLDQNKPVILCGDLNVAHQEIDLKNPKTNRGAAGFSDQERDKFTKLLESGFVDTYRHFYKEQTGAYTWWSYRFKARENNAGWRIDYFCTSSRMIDQVEDAFILSDVMGSDHCPVGIIIKE
jgi:exodeoxyribonuclease-3